jgi:hypothetical protein
MRCIRVYLVRHPGAADVDVTSELAGDGPLILPRAVVVMLASMLAQLAEGRGVTLMPSHAELTTVEAAGAAVIVTSNLDDFPAGYEMSAPVRRRLRAPRGGRTADPPR